VKAELPTTIKSFEIHDIVIIYPFKQYRAGKRWITRVKSITYIPIAFSNEQIHIGYTVMGFGELIKHPDIRIASEAEQLEYKILNANCIPL